MHICILGGGFGGLYTALQLRQSRGSKLKHCKITLVERRDHFLFTPLLYEVVTGELQPWEIAPFYRDLLADHAIQLCQTDVVNVDLRQRQVFLQDGHSLTYDYLVLAVGSENSWHGIPGAREFAQPFRSLTDAETLKERLHTLETSDLNVIRIAIAGSGPNGVELACKLADRLGKRGDIHLIDRSSDILKQFTQGSRVAAYRALSKRNIHLALETSISTITAKTVTLETGAQSRTLDIDLVLWTAGTQMLPWVKALDCAHTEQGQVLVRPTLQLVDYPEAFAVGDLAAIRDGWGQIVPATAQAAFQQAPQLARNLRSLILKRRPRSFRYLHLGEMLTLGTQNAVISSFGLTLTGPVARFIRRAVYIQRLPTLKLRAQVMLHWLFNGIVRRLPKARQQWVRQRVKRWLPAPGGAMPSN